MAEIGEVLRSVCKTHKLPLALTWAPCVQERRGECHHQSDDNCAPRFLIVDSACFVSDENLLGFLEACSEHHLLKGQGIVGKAFTLSKQCFKSDITAFSKSTYPLSHLARMFGLRSALAIPLQSTTTGVVEFVLEFFLPKECQYTEEQNRMVNLLSVVIQQSCQSLQLAMEKELDEVILRVGEPGVTSDGSTPPKDTSPQHSSWISHMIEAPQKGKGISFSWEHKKEEPNKELKVTTQWDDAQAESYHNQAFPGFGQFPQNSGAKSSVEGGGGSSSPDGRRSIGSRKAGEKRQTKTEKTISLQVLSQYFAGSLKDAAKSIGVCPTTLKRICRQHGITRWPSRKIKKVGHSFKKLQLVIDSVQGSEGPIQMRSFYKSFPELTGNGPFSSMKTSDHSEPSNPQPGNGLFSTGAAVSKSLSSSCSQRSGSSTCCSTGAQLNTATVNAMSCRDAQTLEDTKRAHNDAELHALNQEEPNLLARSQSHTILGENATFESLLLPLPKCHKHNLIDGGMFRVKATFGGGKIRLNLQPNWGFKDLQQEIASRFNIEDINKIELKYLDDDHEWVLLTCDADLVECIDIHKSYQSHTIKICLHRASHLKLGKLILGNAPS